MNRAVCFDNIRKYEARKKKKNGPSLGKEQEYSHIGLSQREPKPGVLRAEGFIPRVHQARKD